MRTIQWITVLFSFFVLVAATLYADPCPSLNVKQVIKLPETLKINKIQWDAFYTFNVQENEKKEWQIAEISLPKNKDSEYCHFLSELGECCDYALRLQKKNDPESKAFGTLKLQEPTEPK